MLLIKSNFTDGKCYLANSVDEFCKAQYEELKERQNAQGFKTPYSGGSKLYSWEDWKKEVFRYYYNVLDEDIKMI